VKWAVTWGIELALRDLAKLQSIPVEAAQASWRSEYEVSLRAELQGHINVLGARLAARPQASATAGMPIEPEPDTPPPPPPPPPPTDEEVEDVKFRIELATGDLAKLRSISVEAAQASWRLAYEASLQAELQGYGSLLGAWLAVRPQASATAGMPIKPEPNAELNTPPPPTAKEVDELKSAVDLAICDLAALESIMLPAPGWP
jgi:hypothetical protein